MGQWQIYLRAADVYFRFHAHNVLAPFTL